MGQVSLRADAYDRSKLPKNNRWGYFPAFSLGWDITKEAFMENSLNWLSNLKLRYSWGKNGSIAALSGYAYSNDMASNGLYPFLSVAPYDYIYGALPGTMGNDDLNWETSTQNNIGLNARFHTGGLTIRWDDLMNQT